ncbi:hypothetical protein ITJ38_03540 [Agreia pratensis]|uniref:hypothetical protein n=1 Tax=Agreia pratensis TaxID=150121 RepID=UPI00188B305C|nr:hypothetical protein [Agreia pratensis]MBF4633472.1 hypothetical protein [Agreia pratensis]
MSWPSRVRGGACLGRVDLELRREGNVLGRNQSGGRSSPRLLRLTIDGDLIVNARMAASLIIDDDPGFVQHPATREVLDRRLREVEAEFLIRTWSSTGDGLWVVSHH